MAVFPKAPEYIYIFILMVRLILISYYKKVTLVLIFVGSSYIVRTKRFARSVLCSPGNNRQSSRLTGQLRVSPVARKTIVPLNRSVAAWRACQISTLYIWHAKNSVVRGSVDFSSFSPDLGILFSGNLNGRCHLWPRIGSGNAISVSRPRRK